VRNPLQLDKKTYRLYLESRLLAHIADPSIIAERFNELGIFRFITPIINSGLGDQLTVGALASYLLETFGLQYHGTKFISATSLKRGYYREIHQQLGLNESSASVIEIEIEDIVLDLDKIFIEILKHKGKGYDTILLKPKNPSVFSVMRKSEKACTNFLSNVFSRSIRSASTNHSGSQEVFDLVLHVRMGDVAVIKTASHLVNLHELKRGDVNEGLIELCAPTNGKQKTFRDRSNFEELPALIKAVREASPNLRICVLSDGFDLTRRMVEDSNLQDLIFRISPNVTLSELRSGIDSLEREMNALDVEALFIGESSSTDFWTAISSALNARVVVSTARSFIFNAIAHFKTSGNEQIFYCTEYGGYFNVIESLNVKLVPLRTILEAIPTIADSLRQRYSIPADLIDIAPYASWHTSSVSEWQKQATGKPNDGATSSIGFSFHTDTEIDPFILFDLHFPCKLEAIEIYTRRGYSEKSVPLSVSVGHSLKAMHQVSLFTVPQELYILDSIKSSIRYIKISLLGFNTLNISSIRLKANINNALSFMKYRPDLGRTILCHSPFYGLGGRLAVLATGFGAMIQLEFSNIKYYWGNSILLDFPSEADYTSDFSESVRAFLPQALSSNLLTVVSDARNSIKLSDWLPPDTSKNPLVFISRNNLQRYFRHHERRSSAYRRLYSNIVPSGRVVEIKNFILAKNNLRHNNPSALAIQIRHGNGELYYNMQSNTWGVKPPSATAVIKAINEALTSLNTTISELVVASDCAAMHSLLMRNFGGTYKISFISSEIQDVGAGCNHLNKVFSKVVPRRPVSIAADDLQSFAEILVLASCGAFCGGKSFFVDAVIGFGNFEESKVFALNNQDRYIKIDSTILPLEQVKDSLLVQIVIDSFIFNAIRYDGVFFRENSDSTSFDLFYFDMNFFTGELESFKGLIQAGGLVDFFMEQRGYM
jgi:hypothetical protein